MPAELLQQRSREEWIESVVEHYKAVGNFTPVDARREFVGLLATLPRGLCSFHATRVTDQAGASTLLKRLSHESGPPGPGGHAAAADVLLGVNRVGLHLFQRPSKMHVHSAPYNQIRQVASGAKVRLAPEPVAPWCSPRELFGACCACPRRGLSPTGPPIAAPPKCRCDAPPGALALLNAWLQGIVSRCAAEGRHAQDAWLPCNA